LACLMSACLVAGCASQEKASDKAAAFTPSKNTEFIVPYALVAAVTCLPESWQILSRRTSLRTKR
jgi:hypothetical protein